MNRFSPPANEMPLFACWLASSGSRHHKFHFKVWITDQVLQADAKGFQAADAATANLPHGERLMAGMFCLSRNWKNLRAIHIGGLVGTRIESVEDELARRAEFVFGDADNAEQLRPAALVLDDGHELPVLSGELEALESSLAELRRSHPRIVIDADYRGFIERIDRLQPRWHEKRAIDSDMRRLLH